MADKNGAAAAAEQDRAIAPRAVHGDVIAAYEAMLSQVPDAGDQGIEAILEQIAQATTPGDLDAPWNAGGFGALAGIPIRVYGIRKMPSDFGSGLSFFLVVDGARLDSGEKITATTGSVSVVAQLVKAWSLDAFPWDVVPTLAKRPTKDGYYPMHLENVRG